LHNEKNNQESGADFHFLDIYKCLKNTFPEITFKKKSKKLLVTTIVTKKK
jgi:hypothetical protein